MSTGFNDPTDWISTGSYALNYLISGSFHKGVPLGKVTVFAGESGAGKSYFCAGNIVKHAQDQDIFVVLIDTENALDESWLQALQVDTSPEKLLKLNMSMIDDVAKTISTFVNDYRAMDEEDRPKVLFVVDSLGMLLTPTDVDQFNKGDMKGDMGRKPKALTSLVRNTVNMIGSLNVGLVCTNHTYASQDMFDPDDKISGGAGFIYASSIVVAMKKMKLKEDEDGNKISEVMGIRAGCKVMKTRYAKPFEGVQVKIPYETGMNPYSGLVELFEKKNLLVKQGNRLKYINLAGEEVLEYRKAWMLDNRLDQIMMEYDEKMKPVVQTVDADLIDENVVEE
jgi:RecA/RadA recombinase